MTDSLDVIILSGGKGTRFESSSPKTFIRINSRVLIEYPIFAFRKMSFVARIVLVVSENAPLHLIDEVIHSQNVDVVKGGTERYNSVYNGLQFLSQLNNHSRFVAIHDGARPFVPADVISGTFDACKQCGAASPAIDVVDTIKCVDALGFIDKHLERKNLVQIQTPQMFDFQTIWSAYSEGKFVGVTDDTQLLPDKKVKITQGSKDLFKITYPDDVFSANIIASKYNNF